MTLVVRPAAESDMADIFDTVAADDPAAAWRLLERFRSRFKLLAEHPGTSVAHDEVRPRLRTFPVGRYLVLYRPIEMASRSSA